jgi:hypothetical protein
MGEKMQKNNRQNKWMDGLVMGKCKDRLRKSCNIETNCKHSIWGYGKLPLDNVYTRYRFFLKSVQVWKNPFYNIFSQVYSKICQ